MILEEGSLLIAFIAGLMTTLSPCVLPVLPLILGSSTNKDKLSPFFVCSGLALAYVIFGWSISVFGSFLGLESDILRILSAVFLGIFGIIFIVPKVSDVFIQTLSPWTNRIHRKMVDLDTGSRLASMGIGFLLGAVWTPCSGPTLGTAITLATQEEASIKSLVIMVLFASGAVLPLFLVAYGAGSILRRNQSKIFNLVSHAKKIIGILMIVVAVLVLTGLDKSIEAKVLKVLPDSWVDLTVRF